MKATIDLPDELMQRAKMTAEQRGMELQDLIASLIDQALPVGAVEASLPGQHRPVPVTIPPAGRDLTHLAHAKLDDIFLREHMDRLNLG